MSDQSNGKSLSEARQHAVEAGMTMYHQTAAERDKLLEQAAALRADLAGLKSVCDAQAGQIASLESRIESAVMVRDQALAERIKYEALFVTFQAQLRAFAVPAEPLIRDRS